MAKADPKDERIAELELQLEAANKATAMAETAAQDVGALRAEIAKNLDAIKTRDARILALEGQVTELMVAAGKQNKATVTSLDPAKALQLSVSCTLTNAVTKSPIFASAGDVICLEPELLETQKKVGTSAKVHPVLRDEFEATKKAGRCY